MLPLLGGGNFESVIHAFVTCHLDYCYYCNFLFAGLQASKLWPFLFVQNYAALWGLDTTTSVLHDLDWLLKFRIYFNTKIMTLNCFYLTYLSDSIRIYLVFLFITKHPFFYLLFFWFSPYFIFFYMNDRAFLFISSYIILSYFHLISISLFKCSLKVLILAHFAFI